MKARDVMSSPVIAIAEQMAADAAAALLVSHRFTSAPVVDDCGWLVGVVTEVDLARGRIIPDGWEADERPEPVVAEVMTHAPACMGPDDDLADIVATMVELEIRSVPIVVDGRPVGVVTRQDVLSLVAAGEAASLTGPRRLTRRPRMIG